MSRLPGDELPQLRNAAAAIGAGLECGTDGGGVGCAVADRCADGLDADAEAGAHDAAARPRAGASAGQGGAALIAVEGIGEEELGEAVPGGDAVRRAEDQGADQPA